MPDDKIVILMYYYGEYCDIMNNYYRYEYLIILKR